MELKIVTSVAPYVTAGNSLDATRMAYYDGFAGIEHSEDHFRSMVRSKPDSLDLLREFSTDRRMKNSVHKTLHRPSIDSLVDHERAEAVDYTLQTLDYMEEANIPKMVLHSFSDLPAFLRPKSERANPSAYLIASNAVKIYGLLAPTLKAYRLGRKERIQECFMRSLEEIAKYAADKRVNGRPIEIAFEEHYSDAIDYDSVSYGRGKLANVIRCFDTAHHLIRTGRNSDLSNESGPIHFHAVDTNGFLDDHRTIGTGKVDLRPIISTLSEMQLTDTVVLENGSRKSALASRDLLLSMIRQIESAAP